MEGFDWLQILQYAAYVIAAAAAVAAMTPNTWDNAVVKGLRTILDLAALNVGNAKNEEK
jgi:hypothetical protein